LNLPSALEALERPIGLPPSLLRKAEEVRLEDGPTRIGASIEAVKRLAHQDLAILDEVGFRRIGLFQSPQPYFTQALDILDGEASEDEAARKELPLKRLKSFEANVELIEKANRYRSILTQATESDEFVRQKWDEWEESITELTLDEVILVYRILNLSPISIRLFLRLQCHHRPATLPRLLHKVNSPESMPAHCV
jgi:programmed cell death 6-interacting protein